MSLQIFGHRGYPARFPENSLAGFRYAVAHGIDGVETDVHRTADGELVIMHDEWIDRTTDGHGAIKDYSLAQLRTFHLANGEPIPTFQEFLAAVADADALLDIEFKTTRYRYEGIEAQIQGLVERYGVADRTVYCSFNPDSLVTIHDLAPQMQRCLLTEGAALPAWGRMAALTDVLHPDRYFADLAVPQRLWTIDDPWQMRRINRLPHVTGLITNNFEEAQDVLRLEQS
ncbi:glycerophosphodiester phosphodiesterase family protein [Lacticaseibacillus kribbianus]|uniref:glycerophosphodiester phosphodiesterase family protein n=1 Tax=Lacticaseibacillus kribbianus TaxID=2926292 RepID=UPI001CD752AD|nr:glycerophosphodiester phosphodiesterase family protein [Lacticaseibacillus kribbianus]